MGVGPDNGIDTQLNKGVVMPEGNPRRICNWNLTHSKDKDMGPAPAGSKHDTHGICPDCAKKMG